MHLMPHITDVFTILGAAVTQEAIASADEPFIHRRHWRCGCAVDFVDDCVGAFYWESCSTHMCQPAGRADGIVRFSK